MLRLIDGRQSLDSAKVVGLHHVPKLRARALESASVRALEAVQDWPVDTVAVAVVAADGHVLGEYGPQEHVFELASVTKLLTAYAALIAVEEGALGLDDSAGPPESTIRHLLAHASGVARTPDRGREGGHAAHLLQRWVRDPRRCGRAATGMRSRCISAPACWSARMSSSQLAGSPAAGARSSVADLRRFVVELSNPDSGERDRAGATPGVSRTRGCVARVTGGRTQMTGGSVTRSVTPKHRTGPGRRAHRRPTATLAAVALPVGRPGLRCAASASPTAIAAMAVDAGRY